MASVAPTASRLAQVARMRATIFQTAYNPTSLRTGAKYLRRRLQGASMQTYYPDRISIAQVNRSLPADMKFWDQEEGDRVQKVQDDKDRGKGTPKKAKTKEQSRRAGRRR
ncbi:unnamed protein product [Peniophora sp. CBMAI 1063]|nr:unnamed protein product [Peniophora sp. CBMAI 1063]